MTFNRRHITGALAGAAAAAITRCADAQAPPEESAEARRFRQEQGRVLAKYKARAESRFVQLKEPSLRTHVLVAGRGEPALLIHGGGSVAVNLAGVMAALAANFRCVAPDRPGCGLTDAFDYTNVPFRPHA